MNPPTPLHVSVLLACFAVAGNSAAFVSDVVSVGEDLYLVTAQASNGWSTRGAQKTRAYERAHTFCAAKGKEMQTTESKVSPRGIGQIAFAEITFKCVTPDMQNHQPSADDQRL